MRLTPKERRIIVEVVRDVFGVSEIYLFGSRLDESRVGGDIDLFVIPKDRGRLLKKRLLALHRLKSRLFKPVDLVVHKDFSRHIEKEALRGVRL
jgi:predicted nucleotidyltransferase